MSALVKTQNKPHPVGKAAVPSSNISFLDRNPNASSTNFQEDFQSVPLKKADPHHTVTGFHTEASPVHNRKSNTGHQEDPTSEGVSGKH